MKAEIIVFSQASKCSCIECSQCELGVGKVYVSAVMVISKRVSCLEV